jgi:hypothetical protein
MYDAMEAAQMRQVASGEISSQSFTVWKLRTLGLNITLLLVVFLGIIFI